MSNLSDHDLKQMDEAWQRSQAEPVVRGLLKRALDDLRAARDRLNQGPGNSSRPPGSMPPWQGKRRYVKPQDGADAKPEVAPPETGEPKLSLPVASPAPVEDAANPSSPSPAATTQVSGKTPGRPGRRVGAPGHGREQKLLPSLRQEHHPLSCAACQLSLAGAPAQAWTGWDTLEWLSLQAEQPGTLGIRIEVTRHLLMQSTCSCGHITQAYAAHPEPDSLWPGVEISEQRLLGPRLAAAVVHLCVRMRLPRRKVAELLLEWLGLELSPALISQTVHQAARAVAPLEAQLVAQLEAAALVYVDETSWPEAGKALWLWVLCCATTVLYVIGSRGKELFDNALNVAFAGTLMSDGYQVYRSRLKRLRCWAHLQRKLRGVSESTDASVGLIGARMLKAFEDLIHSIHEARKRAMTPADLPSVTHAAQLRQLQQDCEDHKDHAHKELRAIAREFLNDWAVIISPLSDPHLPLTNNAAESQLRHYVIARRVSYGTRTPVGSHSIALLASVFDTCRLRQASATALLTAAIHAIRMGLPTPPLPPIPANLVNAGIRV